jgi:glutamate racemase
MKRVLVFDSGVGGLSVLDAIAASKLDLELDYVADNAWLPYGLKSDAEIAARVPALLTRMAAQWAPDLVVLACNTASTIALEQTRAALKQPVVGVVPPVKPAAALTRTGVIGLLATPATIRRAYTNDLIANFAGGKRVVRHGTAGLVAAAEAKLRGEGPPLALIKAELEGLFDAPGGAEIDVVALACTHFPLLGEELALAAPRAISWLDSGEAIARRVANLLIMPANAGAPRARMAGFTDAASAEALAAAFYARGFEVLANVNPAPGFEAAPLTRV